MLSSQFLTNIGFAENIILGERQKHQVQVLITFQVNESKVVVNPKTQLTLSPLEATVECCNIIRKLKMWRQLIPANSLCNFLLQNCKC